MALYLSDEPGAIDPGITEVHILMAIEDGLKYRQERLREGSEAVYDSFGYTDGIPGGQNVRCQTHQGGYFVALLYVLYVENGDDHFVLRAREADEKELAENG